MIMHTTLPAVKHQNNVVECLQSAVAFEMGMKINNDQTS